MRPLCNMALQEAMKRNRQLGDILAFPPIAIRHYVSTVLQGVAADAQALARVKVSLVASCRAIRLLAQCLRRQAESGQTLQAA